MRQTVVCRRLDAGGFRDDGDVRVDPRRRRTSAGTGTVEEELRAWGHETVAPDLPCDDHSATLSEYVDTVVRAVDGRRDLVVVAQSYGGFTAPLVADRLPVDALVLVTAMIPAPGERPADWWINTGHGDAVREEAERDGGLTGNNDPLVAFTTTSPAPWPRRR